MAISKITRTCVHQGTDVTVTWNADLIFPSLKEAKQIDSCHINVAATVSATNRLNGAAVAILPCNAKAAIFAPVFVDFGSGVPVTSNIGYVKTTAGTPYIDIYLTDPSSGYATFSIVVPV